MFKHQGLIMDDKAIIDLFWERSERAITETAKKYGSFCHNISYRILKNSQDAEECVNDTWLRAWDSIPPRRPERLAVYLGKITQNLSLDRYRHYSAEKRKIAQTAEVFEELFECVSGGDNVSDHVDRMILTELIEKFLRKQSEENRNIFIRRYWYYDSVREIAADFGVNERSIATVLFRMRAQLKKELLKEGIEL